ncbi:MAG: aminoglycoside phosphotransferase family protein [Thermodesulfobacteriota bacterium]
MIPFPIIKTIVRQWGLSCKKIRPDLPLEGSPERSLWRAAFEDEAGGLFVLEQIVPSLKKNKERISRTLDGLYRCGFTVVVPSLKILTGAPLGFYDGFWWQVTPYVTGIPLARPGYIHDSERGTSLARVLEDLYRCGRELLPAPDLPVFSLKRYVLKLEQDMKRYDPAAAEWFAPVFDFLRRSFFDAHDALPTTFCHGDFHPLNVIWQNSDITAVIDWEFCGFKPDIYDAANLVGCVGMEHPSGLTGGLATAFIHSLKQAAVISDHGWRFLPEWVTAMRFAWLAEWLRKKDGEMIDLEAVYMNLLVKNAETLRDEWDSL